MSRPTVFCRPSLRCCAGVALLALLLVTAAGCGGSPPPPQVADDNPFGPADRDAGSARAPSIPVARRSSRPGSSAAETPAAPEATVEQTPASEPAAEATVAAAPEPSAEVPARIELPQRSSDVAPGSNRTQPPSSTMPQPLATPESAQVAGLGNRPATLPQGADGQFPPGMDGEMMMPAPTGGGLMGFLSRAADMIASMPQIPGGPPRTDWGGFRGNDGSGIAPDIDLPTAWDDEENLIWRAKIPGPGSSSPIVWNGRVYITWYTGIGPTPNVRNLRRWVGCFDGLTGDKLWEYQIPSGDWRETPHTGYVQKHGYASSTPVTDGRLLYVMCGTAGIHVLTRDGQSQGQFPIGSETDSWGSGSSPVLFGNLLLVNASVEAKAWGAMSREGGGITWQDEASRTWATPAVVETVEGDYEVVLSMEKQVVAFNPATGEKLWWCRGVDDYVCPSPVSGDGVVYVIGGRSGRAIAIRTGGRGDVNDTHVIWRKNVGSNVSSPVLLDNHLYWVNEKGIACCLNAETGEIVTQERLDTGEVYASVVAADGNLYVPSRNKGVFVLSATPDMELLAINRFERDSSPFNGSIAVANRKLYFRSNSFLYCVGLPDAAVPSLSSGDDEEFFADGMFPEGMMSGDMAAPAGEMPADGEMEAGGGMAFPGMARPPSGRRRPGQRPRPGMQPPQMQFPEMQPPE